MTKKKGKMPTAKYCVIRKERGRKIKSAFLRKKNAVKYREKLKKFGVKSKLRKGPC